MAYQGFPEYLAALENTRYPFVPTATLSNGYVRFLEGAFLDAHIYPVDGIGRYFLSQVVVTASSLRFVIGDSQSTTRCQATIDSPPAISALQLRDSAGRPSGILLSEPTRLAAFSGWGEGTYVFEQGQTEFAVTCCVPVPDPGVTSLRTNDGASVSGRVWLVGESGVILDSTQKVSNDGKVQEIVRVNIVGDPLYLQTRCEPESAFTPVNPVRGIRILGDDFDHTCYPDESGNFNIQATPGLTSRPAFRVRTTPDGIMLRVEGSAL